MKSRRRLSRVTLPCVGTILAPLQAPLLTRLVAQHAFVRLRAVPLFRLRARLWRLPNLS